MLLFGLLILQLFVLFFLSRWLNGSLFQLFYQVTRSRKLSIIITTLLLFPGTIVHELSHLFIAEILQVRTGKLSLFPVIHDNEYVEAGSVEVAKTDPIRRTIIGIAPLLVGVIVITLLSQQLANIYTNVFQTMKQLNNETMTPETILFFLFLYLLFAATNNMFPSKEDMQGVPAVFLFLALIILTAYVVGVRFTLSGRALEILLSIGNAITGNLFLVIVMNIVLLILLRVFLLATRRYR